MCRRYALSAYDAAYFELAMRLDLPLAAKDGPLVEAARKVGIAFA
jgi:predicted nucleic acid-binding protein